MDFSVGNIPTQMQFLLNIEEKGQYTDFLNDME
jgi:hypothetical protein